MTDALLETQRQMVTAILDAVGANLDAMHAAIADIPNLRNGAPLAFVSDALVRVLWEYQKSRALPGAPTDRLAHDLFHLLRGSCRRVVQSDLELANRETRQ